MVQRQWWVTMLEPLPKLKKLKSSGGTWRSKTEGRALRKNSAQGVFNFKNWEQCGSCEGCSGYRCLNVRLIAGEVGLPKTDVHWIITEDLHMRKICAKLVLKNLSDVWEFLAQNNITTPTIQPWLGFVRFFLFPKLKIHLKGHHFGTGENVQAAAMRALNNISSEDFLRCYEEWQQRRNHCIRSQGAYFEGDKL